MQITLIRHGKYDQSTGHLSYEGIDDTVMTGLALGNAVTKKLLDFLFDIEYKGLNPKHLFPPKDQEIIQEPDLILTSSALRAKETGFTFANQLKNMGIDAEVRNDIAYLDDLDLVSDDYKLNHHNFITEETAKKMISLPSIQKTVDFIRRLGKEGKKHIVLVSHQPNIHVLLNLLSEEPLIARAAPKNSVAYTILSVNPENIGKEKYPTQVRYVNPDMKRAYALSYSTIGIYVPSAEDVLWKMPDFMFNDKMKAAKKAHKNSNGKV